MVEEAHLQTIYGGVTLTVTKIRDQYWIPTLRQLVKRIIKTCYACKRFNISHYPKPSQGLIPTDRTKQNKVIYSDNAKALERASNWIKNVYKDEKMQECLVAQQVKWKFNLSRAPWWSGQFGRMVGLLKQCLYKATGKRKLKKQELEEAILDAEVILNNRSLMCIDDDIQFLVLTPKILIHGQPITIPEEQFDDNDEVITKRQRYIKHCKECSSNSKSPSLRRS